MEIMESIISFIISWGVWIVVILLVVGGVIQFFQNLSQPRIAFPLALALTLISLLSGGIIGVVEYITWGWMMSFLADADVHTEIGGYLMFLIIFSPLILETAIGTLIYLKVLKTMNWIPELRQKYDTLAAVPAIFAVVIMIIYGFLISYDALETIFFIMGTLFFGGPSIGIAVLTGEAVKKFSLLGDENLPG